MKAGRQILFLVLGTVVLVGCQQQTSSTTVERQRWAGEVHAVASPEGLMRLSCVQALAAQKTNQLTKADLQTCIVASAPTDASTATMARKRMFYSETSLTYLYLPYYSYDPSYSAYYPNNTTNTTNYSSSSYTDNSQYLCQLLFGRKCWRNDWYSTYFNYQPQQTAQYYNPGCNNWLSTSVQYSSQYQYQDYSSSFYQNPYSNWNNSYSSCYNVY